MLRLFISLYLAIVIGIYTINWGSEVLWQNLATPANEQHQQLKQLIKTLPSLLQQNQAKKQHFEQQSGLSLNYLEFDDVAWLPEQKSALVSGEVVTTYTGRQTLMFYIKGEQENSLYQLGPIAVKTAENSLLKYSILVVSYLLLAACIALWTRPIWRDLLQLKSIAKEIEKGNFQLNYKVNKHSPTAVIVQTFQQLTQHITRLLLEQKHLINAVSHELRTPLARLRFSAAMMDNIQPEQLAEITTDIKEMEKLVDEMLDYSRIENIDKPQEKSNINIGELLTNLVEKHQRSTEKKLFLSISKEHAQPLVFYGNGHLIERACQNLICNALKYAEKEVNISAEIMNQQLNISVSDDGQGIEPENIEKIFQPFVKLDKSRNKTTDGVGLGLAIVQRIMLMHQGHCTCQAVKPNGVKFSLLMPVISV
ncbi:ATP-binding protein [Thalassotalea agariperforans]